MGVRIHEPGNTYHAVVTVDGREYRRSLKTNEEREAGKRAYGWGADIRRQLAG